MLTILASAFLCASFRPSGWTRVVHAKNRLGDNAPLSFLEFVDRPGELRPAMLCTEETFEQVRDRHRKNVEEQRKNKY